jgi:hypothetical protein
MDELGSGGHAWIERQLHRTLDARQKVERFCQHEVAVTQGGLHLSQRRLELCGSLADEIEQAAW